MSREEQRRGGLVKAHGRVSEALFRTATQNPKHLKGRAERGLDAHFIEIKPVGDRDGDDHKL